MKPYTPLQQTQMSLVFELRHLRQLCATLPQRLSCRQASTSSPHSNQYPFPTHARPTPHQIFHLPTTATKQDVKSRYYDLVRIHHPDSPHCRHLDSAIRHAQFQSIRSAYDYLMGRGFTPSGSYDPAFSELDRIRRAQEAHRRARARRREAEFADGFGRKREWEASADDRWKDRMIFFTGVVCLFIGIGPGIWSSTQYYEQVHTAASANLAQARSEAREYGSERRQEIRRRVKENQENQDQGRLSTDGNDSEDHT
ncbi:hypothetical protein QCA50_020377 [Cerrena zonata]|uniref:J domain-containing protein n=1 Tax=Cerrena zonata TaxID=2478898 RepID=A0AAW0FBT9_9APHY